LYAANISIAPLPPTSSSISSSTLLKTDKYLDDTSSAVSMKNLKLYGNYNSTIKTEDLYLLPAPFANYGYFKMHIPTGHTNITISLANDNVSRAEFTMVANEDNRNAVGNQAMPVVLENVSITLTNVKSASTPYLSVIMKNPIVEGSQRATLQSLRSHYPADPTKPLADLWPTEIKGNFTIELDHITYDPTNPSRYITYFNWIGVNSSQIEPQLNSFGELLDTPWKDVWESRFSFVLIPSLIIAGAFAISRTFKH
jgi:hypothetical protein